MDHAAITRALHSRLTLSVAVVMALAGAVMAYMAGGEPPIPASQGFVKGWGAPVSLPPYVGVAVALALNGAIVAMSLWLNKTYNLLRTLTRLSTALFLIMQLATPVVLLAPTPGLLLCLVVLLCVALMYTIYTSGRFDARRVFLVFCMLSACSSFDYAYVLYVPIFVLACMQLRFFGLRCALATIMGLLTPWIIFMGFGIVPVGSLQWPHIGFGESLGGPVAEGTVVLTACLAVGAWLQNVMKIITYNSRSRSMLSVLTIVTLITVIASVADISHTYCYIVLLNYCAAFQITHIFVAIHNFDKSYIVVFALVILYLLICSWSIILTMGTAVGSSPATT